VGVNDTEPAHDWYDGRHPATIEEWVFSAWTADGELAVVSGHRIIGRTAWYWAALARRDRPLLHVCDFDVPVRADPFIVKGEAMWAEHFCDAEMEQWSVGNETYAAAFDDPQEALGRGYGVPTPIAFDLEWYATAGPVGIGPTVHDAPGVAPRGYSQSGVVHGSIEVAGERAVELEEVPARRWHRWVDADLDAGFGSAVGAGRSGPAMAPIELAAARAHTGVRAAFRFPDGSTIDWVATTDGWRRRVPS
jgi:hypothetical protein